MASTVTVGGYLRAVVLYWGSFWPRGDIWQCLESFSIVTTGVGVYYGYLESRGQKWCKHFTMYWTAPHNRAPNVNCAEVEPCLTASRLHWMLQDFREIWQTIYSISLVFDWKKKITGLMKSGREPMCIWELLNKNEGKKQTFQAAA